MGFSIRAGPAGDRLLRRLLRANQEKITRTPSMSRQDANAAFALSSFLQGTNATYIDEIYARYEKDPSSVDAEWQGFFKSLNDQPADVRKNAEGPSWERANWPLTPKDDLTSALDGNWAEVEKVVGAKIAAKAQAKGAEISSAD